MEIQLKPKGNWTRIVVQKIRNRTYLVKTDSGSECKKQNIY